MVNYKKLSGELLGMHGRMTKSVIKIKSNGLQPLQPRFQFVVAPNNDVIRRNIIMKVKYFKG